MHNIFYYHIKCIKYQAVCFGANSIIFGSYSHQNMYFTHCCVDSVVLSSNLNRDVLIQIFTVIKVCPDLVPLFRNIYKHCIHTIQQFCFLIVQKLFQNRMELLNSVVCLHRRYLLWKGSRKWGENLDNLFMEGGSLAGNIIMKDSPCSFKSGWEFPTRGFPR